MAARSKKNQPLSIVEEARICLGIAEILQGFSPEKACAIMAGASAALGHYDEAQRFLTLSKQYAEQDS